MPDRIELLKVEFWWSIFLMGIMVGMLGTEFLEFNRMLDGNERLVRIYNEIVLGEDDSSVANKVIANIDGETVSSEYEGDAMRWLISAPKFFQGYWILVLCFTDGRLGGVSFGTGDEIGIRPREAPSSKGYMC